ncbi:MAG: hypothetical protein ACRCU3_01955 [Eubacteriaceae bacterium]
MEKTEFKKENRMFEESEMSLKEKLKILAVERLKTLKLSNTAIQHFFKKDVLYSSNYGGLFRELTENQKEKIKELELKNSLVYHVIRGNYTFSDDTVMEFEDYLILTSEDLLDLELGKDENIVFVYTKNITYPDFSEYGYIQVASKNGGLIRTA